MPPATATVPVKSPWTSKINWVSIVTAAVALLSALGIVIPEEYQRTALELAGTIGPLATIVIRTWFTKTIISESVK